MGQDASAASTERINGRLQGTFERMFENIDDWAAGDLSSDAAMHRLAPDVVALEMWFHAYKAAIRSSSASGPCSPEA